MTMSRIQDAWPSILCALSDRNVQSRPITGAGLAVIASVVLALPGTSMAATPPTPPAVPAADRLVSHRLAFEANRGQVDARKAIRILTGSIHVVTKVRRRIVSAGCAEALKEELHAARDRAAQLLATVARP